MEIDDFIDLVAARTGGSRSGQRAKALADATFATLGERISGGEARALASSLPKEAQSGLVNAGEASESFGVDEFYRRVAERAEVNEGMAQEGAAAVLQTLRELVGDRGWENLVSQLPLEYDGLVGPMK